MVYAIPHPIGEPVPAEDHGRGGALPSAPDGIHNGIRNGARNDLAQLESQFQQKIMGEVERYQVCRMAYTM
eukprot:2333913-Pyramimonas_sp.AAC.1